ncbi:hypothetical protein ElyMa_005718600 [Elysia marginata]|uniref:Uncharacterized protein n=1 Tax=Elysia marginata TaxID=1093978 RepID=A0AAV4FJ44_9GAST|nr:hypothetical protein ElyMa_005718600 [Elysia marginata]
MPRVRLHREPVSRVRSPFSPQLLSVAANHRGFTYAGHCQVTDRASCCVPSPSYRNQAVSRPRPQPSRHCRAGWSANPLTSLEGHMSIVNCSVSRVFLP